jgi:hypothetical protein
VEAANGSRTQQLCAAHRSSSRLSDRRQSTAAGARAFQAPGRRFESCRRITQEPASQAECLPSQHPIAVELIRIVRVVAQAGGEPPELGGALEGNAYRRPIREPPLGVMVAMRKPHPSSRHAVLAAERAGCRARAWPGRRAARHAARAGRRCAACAALRPRRSRSGIARSPGVASIGEGRLAGPVLGG